MYSICIARRAVKEIAGLPGRYPRLVSEHIEDLACNPRPANSKRLTDRIGYSLRVGSYRILYEVNDQSKTVVVRRVKHRRDAYRD